MPRNSLHEPSKLMSQPIHNVMILINLVSLLCVVSPIVNEVEWWIDLHVQIACNDKLVVLSQKNTQPTFAASNIVVGSHHLSSNELGLSCVRKEIKPHLMGVYVQDDFEISIFYTTICQTLLLDDR